MSKSKRTRAGQILSHHEHKEIREMPFFTGNMLLSFLVEKLEEIASL